MHIQWGTKWDTDAPKAYGWAVEFRPAAQPGQAPTARRYNGHDLGRWRAIAQPERPFQPATVAWVAPVLRIGPELLEVLD